ncbi:unnamed protein product [Ambrosiozyma monospora]|uniref:Unnamed protein product n=1 Tax=Ambrosiozyma monospora TaxID=43982 RepID=A0ACB5UAJ0_AMBMO|nr:unnamed protein product [Ambrosiozyma monospora]
MGPLQSFFKSFKFYTKGVFAFAILMVGAAYGITSSIVLALVGKRNLSQYSTARFFYYLFGTIFGITIKIDRPELLEQLPAVIISNHQSELDVFMLDKSPLTP